MVNFVEEKRQWSLLSSHGQVLISISRAPELTVRRLSQLLNFSERRIMGVLRDLEDAGLIQRERRGRQNLYTINQDAGLRAPLLKELKVRDLLRGLRSGGAD
ncbi:MAG: helix-turn-helix transcriptional regulator [Dehalococcoidia bacterium]